jgi:membrane peptidoglycan carboxypeptidase
MIKLTERIEPDKFYKYLRNFGFGSKTGIELPGEQSGSLKKPTRFSAVSKPFMSIGYEIAVTPLQITNAYAAIVNGGKLLRPYVMKAIEDNSMVIEKTEPEEIREVISTGTSNTLRTWLTGVVEEGTAQAAQISNLLVGGKTGTSQKLIGKVYSHTDYYTSFVGFFPAESPKLVCYIMVDSPRKQKYGGTVAAPIFKNVVDGLIALDPTLGSDKKIERKQKGYDEFLVDVKKEKSKTNIKSFADVGTKKNIKIDSDQGYFGRTTMPSLIGKSKRDAVEVVSSLGLNYEVTGHGRVVKQSVKPGSKIKKYMKVKLVCKAR